LSEKKKEKKRSLGGGRGRGKGKLTISVTSLLQNLLRKTGHRLLKSFPIIFDEKKKMKNEK